MTNQEASERLSASLPYPCYEKKPIEIYMFIDPLSPECWALEPILKKLQIEYGNYFTIKHVISGSMSTLNVGRKNIADFWNKTGSRFGMSCDGNLWLENPISSPYLASIGIKAAELQGRKAGSRFLRKLQEIFFIEKKNISSIEVLQECAEKAELDVAEFLSDINSNSAAKAFQCDLKISTEMDVTEMPTLVFFNENIEDEGIKITGYYPYEVYVQIMIEMLEEEPVRTPPPPLEEFLKRYHLVATTEISVVFSKPIQTVERELKKLQLKQLVEKIPAKHGTFWRYIAKDT